MVRAVSSGAVRLGVCPVACSWTKVLCCRCSCTKRPRGRWGDDVVGALHDQCRGPHPGEIGPVVGGEGHLREPTGDARIRPAEAFGQLGAVLAGRSALPVMAGAIIADQPR